MPAAAALRLDRVSKTYGRHRALTNVSLAFLPADVDGEIGWVAAGGFGYSVGKSIIYAYLPVDCTKVGTKLHVEFFGERVEAEVVQSPLWDPKGERIRA
mgnify:CR=1 FL=1